MNYITYKQVRNALAYYIFFLHKDFFPNRTQPTHEQIKSLNLLIDYQLKKASVFLNEKNNLRVGIENNMIDTAS